MPYSTAERLSLLTFLISETYCFKGMVNSENSQDKGPPECNSARG